MKAAQSKHKLHWGIRLLLAAVILVVAGVSILTILTIHESDVLENRVASLRNSGEPISPNDFATPNPDAHDNGALILDRAIQIVDQSNKDDIWQAYGNLHPAYPLRPEEIKTMQALEKQNAAALDLIDQAKAKPRMEWKLNLTSPVLVNSMLPDMSGLRSLCQLLSCCAMLNHTKGNDALAIHQIQDIIFLSRFADKHPSLVGHLVSIGCAALASEQIEEIAPDLKIGSAPGQATPEQIGKMIDLLLDDGPPRAGFKLAMRGERMMQLDAMRSLIAGSPMTPTTGPAIMPRTNAFSVMHLFMYENAIAMLNYMTQLIPITDQPTWPAAKAKMPPSPAGTSFSPGTLFLRILLPSMDRAVETHFRGMTDRRLSAIALALRWYAVEHNGKLPSQLSDLTHRYLAAVPRDPFAAGDQPMRYRATGKSPIIYSVSDNGSDDSGSEDWNIEPKRYHANPPNEWETKDRVVHLTRQPRTTDDESTTQPTTTTSGNQQ